MSATWIGGCDWVRGAGGGRVAVIGGGWKNQPQQPLNHSVCFFNH